MQLSRTKTVLTWVAVIHNIVEIEESQNTA